MEADGEKEQSSETFDIILHEGSVYRQSFKGLGSAGYTWNFFVEGSPDVILVEFTTIKPPIMNMPSSYDTDYLYTITALKQGRVSVRFYLHRVWEHDKPPLRECIINVSVV